MYNEVYCKCPSCGTEATMQVSQVVLGFGGFNIDNLSGSEWDGLSDRDLQTLYDRIKDEWFCCENPHCNVNRFNRLRDDVHKDLKYELFR